MSDFLFYKSNQKLTPDQRRKIAEKIRHFEWIEDQSIQHEDWEILHSKNKTDTLEVFEDPNTGDLFILQGYLYESDSFGKGIRFRDEPKKKQACLMDRYKAEGIDGLTGLNGTYNILVWNKKEQTLQVANDRIGIFQIFYFGLDNGDFILTTNLAHLKVICPDQIKIDRRGLFDLLYMGYQFEERTVLEGARRLLPHTSYGIKDGVLKILKQKKLNFSQKRWGDALPKVLDNLEHYYSQAVGRQLNFDEKYMYLQSGGKDSRLYSYFLKQRGIQPDCFTYGERHQGEVYLSELVVRNMGFPWRRIPVDEDIEFDNAEKFFAIDSFAGQTFSSWYFCNLNKDTAQTYDACLSAFMVDVFTGDVLIKGGPQLDSDAKETFNYYIQKLRLGFLTMEQLSAIFGEDAYDLEKQYLKEAFELFQSLGEVPYQMLIAYDLRVKTRMKIGACLRSIHAGMPVRLPVLDTDLMDYGFSLSPSILYDRLLIDQFLIRRKSVLGAIPIDANHDEYKALIPSAKLLMRFRLWRAFIRKIYVPILKRIDPKRATMRTYLQAFSMRNRGFKRLNKEALQACAVVDGILNAQNVKKILSDKRIDDVDPVLSGNVKRSLCTVVFAVKEFYSVKKKDLKEVCL